MLAMEALLLVSSAGSALVVTFHGTDSPGKIYGTSGDDLVGGARNDDFL
jgi:hypothetical protein